MEGNRQNAVRESKRREMMVEQRGLLHCYYSAAGRVPLAEVKMVSLPPTFAIHIAPKP